jgi:hypothetical protein
MSVHTNNPLWITLSLHVLRVTTLGIPRHHIKDDFFFPGFA